MDIATVLSLGTITVGTCLYFRRETKTEINEFKEEMKIRNLKLDADMKEFRDGMNEFRKETKDFHGRMCTLEEKYQQMNRKKGDL